MNGDIRRVCLLLIGALTIPAAPLRASDEVAVDPKMDRVVEASLHFLTAPPDAHPDALVYALLDQPIPTRRPQRNIGLDLTPVLQRALGERHRKRRHKLRLSASFHLAEALPAVNFRIGDKDVDTLGAFYETDSDVSGSLVYAVQDFTLRIQAGDDSEFGYHAIGGIQWQHTERPLAAGIGIPLNLHTAEGNAGVVFQIRMKLR